jgi:hypothetical protein
MAARRPFLANSATGTTTSAVIAIAANPPITAGTSDRQRRAVQRHPGLFGLIIALSTQGRPA